MNCPIKKKQEEEAMSPIVKELLAKPCPNCGSAMTLRRSMYGEFLGCSAYPKCKTIIQIPKHPGEEPKVIDYSKKKTNTKRGTRKKTAKKSTSKKSTTKKSTTKKVTKKVTTKITPKK
jgi:ssDNA-binding Zn-finger/Zn-ribbon topoisomerase 1